MTRVLRTFARIGQDRNVWPVVLLLFAVLVPAVSLLWFMSAAMQNERLAARQKLAEAYRSQLSTAQARLDKYWNETAAELQKLGQTSPASAAFARCIQSGRADSVVIHDERGRILYPNRAVVFETGIDESEKRWAAASQLEYLRNDWTGAARLYDSLAKSATNVHIAARACQAEARCLVRSGQGDSAIRLIEQTLGDEVYRCAVDPQGRLIAANAELMALELTTDRASPVFRSLVERLEQRLVDYENPAIAAPQRRFLMTELQRLSPETELPTLAAERVAAEFCEHQSPFAKDSALHSSLIADVWQFTTSDGRVVALLRSNQLLPRMRALAVSDNLPADAEITLAPPETDASAALVSLPAGPRMPGWHVTLSLSDQKLFDSTAEHRRSLYLWTGLLVAGAMGVLGLLAAQVVRRQMALAGLKNDLAATVSHELKTPLSSMRVLVDTLLSSDTLNEHTVREYLQLIAQENERLSRLIENFLTFSRMERKKYSFQFKPLPATDIVASAAAAVRQRFELPGCRFEAQVQDELPEVIGDGEALVTALLNLLDNAHKYTGDIKHIVLRVTAVNGHVLFSVQDNGPGVAPREMKRIFQPFFQANQDLSRNGGCGLGLSIVQSIVTAHRGTVSVNSRPGCGSTFTISIPAAQVPATARKEAIA